jgi:hypothetical protein
MTSNSQVRVANQREWGREGGREEGRENNGQVQPYEVKWREITQLVCSVDPIISVPLVKSTYYVTKGLLATEDVWTMDLTLAVMTEKPSSSGAIRG